jgi:hypothetical protein
MDHSHNRASIRLSMLARHQHQNNQDNHDSSSSLWDKSSQLLISDLAEQSVNNFVRNFMGSSQSQLPIAATVVPSEEDLEQLIRSRLEAELQSHLTEELQNFRQNLVQGILQLQLQQQQQPPVQVADPVSQLDAEQYRYLFTNEQFQDEQDENDSSGSSSSNSSGRSNDGDMSQSGGDQLMALEAPAVVPPTRRMPALGNDFRRSIRESIRMEFGALEEELDVEQAQVVASIRGTEVTALSVEPSSSHEEGLGFLKNKNGEASKDKQKFNFSARGLLGSVFLVFLIGVLVGAGASILTMRSME